jgi:cellulose biosynthesis protein BcsQ
MSTKTKLISFGNMKGGVGKSTLTSVLANYIFNKQEQTVVVCDCDDKQTSLVKERETDIELGNDPEDLYQILSIKSADFEKQYIDMIDGNVDICLLDLPGNLMQKGVIQSYFHADIIIIPTSLSKKDFDSSLAFFNEYSTTLEPLRLKNNLPPIKFYGVLNKVEKTSLEYKEFVKIKNELPFHFLDTVLSYAPVTFQRNASTVNDFSLIKKTKGVEKDIVKEFCEELMSLINI